MFYIVSTPIGNLNDLSPRALEILKKVDLILAEDTRRTGQLLAHFEIKKPLLSFHEHNEVQRIPEIINKLRVGEEIALVSDAGTPLISDPGFKLIRALRDENLPLTALPGPNAAITALTLSALPTDKFFFVGYLPKTSGKRETLLKNLVQIKKIAPSSFIFYESPHRIVKLIGELEQFFPDSTVSVQRELTKIHEEIVNGHPSDFKKHFSQSVPKGEFTIVIY